MRQRVLTAALLIPPVLLAVFLYESFWLYLLSLVTFCIGYVELNGIAMSKRSIPVLGFLVGFGMPFLLPIAPWGHGSEIFEISKRGAVLSLAVLSMGGAFGALLISCGRRGYLLTEIASLWIIAPLLSIVQLKSHYGDWVQLADFKTPVLFCLIPIWIGDTLAIFVGKAFGKRPLAPKISPKKTIEGGIANLFGCLASAIGLAYLIHQPLIVGVLVGLATGILGQLGDLLQSAMKRSAGVKDSGTLLPGHGGLLDRIDSILLSAPVVALIVVTLGNHSG